MSENGKMKPSVALPRSCPHRTSEAETTKTVRANKNKQPLYTERLCFRYVSLSVPFLSPFVYPCPLPLFWIYSFFCLALLQYMYLSHNVQCWLSRERHKPRRLLVTAYFQVPECSARRRLGPAYQARMPTKIKQHLQPTVGGKCL